VEQFRCKKCRKLLAKYEYFTKIEIKCPRCNYINKLIKDPKDCSKQPLFK